MAADASTRPDYYVSYADADEAWAEWIGWVLQTAGFRVQLAAWDRVAGTNWILRVHEGVRDADTLIAVVSPDYLASVSGTAEWTAMWSRDPLGAEGRIIPVVVADCDRKALGLLLSRTWVDLRAHAREDSGAATEKRLLAELRAAHARHARPETMPARPILSTAAPSDHELTNGDPHDLSALLREVLPDAVDAATHLPVVPGNARRHLLRVLRTLWLQPVSHPLGIELPLYCLPAPGLVNDDPWRRDDGWPGEDAANRESRAEESIAGQSSDEHTEFQAETLCQRTFADDPAARLILVGGAGAGKTSLLLSLADWLARAAARDRRLPVPLVLLLQDWRDPGIPFVSWAADDVAARYRVPRAKAARWLADGGIVLLADGLDELPPGRRAAFHEAINSYLQDDRYADTGFVLTSREAEYRDHSPLALDAAFVLRRPRRDEVLAGLAAAPGDLSALRSALEVDDVLADLLDNPLMVGVAAVALAGAAPDELPLGPGDARRAQLYRRYLETLLRRPRGRRAQVGTIPLEQAQVLYRRVVMLARLLTARQSNVFYHDWITPDWLAAGYAARSPWAADTRFVRVRALLAMTFPLALFAAVALPLYVTAGGLALGPVGGLWFGIAGTVAFALGRGFLAAPLQLSARWRWSWSAALIGIGQGVAVGLGIVLCSALILGTIGVHPMIMYAGALIAFQAVHLTLDPQERGTSAPGILISPIAGLAVGIVTGGVDTPWRTAFSLPVLVKGWPGFGENVRHVLASSADSLFDGTNVGAIAGLLGGLAGGWAGGITFGFAFGVLGTLPGGVAVAVAFGLTRGMVADYEVAPRAPAEALRASGRVLVRVTLVFLLLAGVLLCAVTWLGGPVSVVAAVALVDFVLVIGAGPGRAWLSYWSTRWYLAIRGVLPWSMERFLSGASERALLHRAGGGFRFVHATFRDYLASLDEQGLTPQGRLADGAPATWERDPAVSDAAFRDDYAVLARLWERSPLGRGLVRASTAALTSRPARTAGRVASWTGVSAASGARGAVPFLLCGILGYVAIGVSAEVIDDDAALPAGAAGAVLGLIVLVLARAGVRPPRSLRAAVGRTTRWGGQLLGASRQWVRRYLARHPQVRSGFWWTAGGTAAGFGFSRFVVAVPGTPHTVDSIVSWVFTLVGASGTFVYFILRRR